MIEYQPNGKKQEMKIQRQEQTNLVEIRYLPIGLPFILVMAAGDRTSKLQPGGHKKRVCFIMKTYHDSLVDESAAMLPHALQ